MSAMSEDRVSFSRVADPEHWEPMPYVDRLEWRGWYVLIDGDTVRFGDGEYDWVKPVAKDRRPRELEGAKLAQRGRWLVVTSGPYEFVFYDVADHKYQGEVIGQIFHYRWRYRNRLRRLALKKAQEVVRRLD